MGTEKHVGVQVDKECILHVASRMIGSEIQRLEYMPVVFNFGAFGNSEARTAEDVDDLLAYKRQRVACTDALGCRRTG